MDKDQNNDTVLELIEFFYPIHYKVGMALEDSLRLGKLTRKQVAILWLIRSEGAQGRQIQRKRIEQLLSGWFEISGSAITKSLRAMARPPLGLIQMAEDPRSGREKQVWLTPKGERFVQQMVARGCQFVSGLAQNFSAEEIREVIVFFRRLTEVIKARPAANGAAARS